MEGSIRRWAKTLPGSRKTYYGIVNTLRYFVPVRAYRLFMFYFTFGYVPNIENPRTFNEKILYKMLFDRRPLISLFCDKVRVREYVARKVGDSVCFPRLHGVYEDSADIVFSDLPDQFVLKSTHGSGWNVVVKDRKGTSERKLRSTARWWLSQNYFNYAKEWCYKDLKPMVIAEEFLSVDGRSPVDFKVFCFNGRAGFVQVDYDRFGDHRRDLFDIDWHLIEGAYVYANSDETEKRPKNLTKMIQIAEALSSDTDFVRVDLYSVGDRIYFGELTNYPEDGLGRFTPSSLDGQFGALWAIPRHYG